MLFALGFVFMFTIGGLSGVVLANASLDIAFHDKVFIIFSVSINLLILFSMEKITSTFIAPDKLNKDSKFHNFEYDNTYIKVFWVGLMDGDGSIQVNHWRKKSLQYRLIIKLSNTNSNYAMLIDIAKVIGGTVRKVDKGKFIIWVEDHKDKISKIIEIYNDYPPLTSRINCQLIFLKSFLSKPSINDYLLKRNLKYDIQSNIIRSKINFTLPHYFYIWLSGFIEAEGCFSLRKHKNHSFSIGQKDDLYLINAIKVFFEIKNIIRNPYDRFYSIEVYKKETLLKIINHCHNYPLLGQKKESLISFSKHI